MKHFTIALLATAVAVAVSPARAESRFSIGVNLGGPAYRPTPPGIAFTPPPVVVYAPARGYWDEIVVQAWVPERWVITRDHRGRIVRICEPGYYTYRTDRVWIDNRNPGHHPAYRGSHSHDTSHGRWGR